MGAAAARRRPQSRRQRAAEVRHVVHGCLPCLGPVRLFLSLALASSLSRRTVHAVWALRRSSSAAAVRELEQDLALLEPAGGSRGTGRLALAPKASYLSEAHWHAVKLCLRQPRRDTQAQCFLVCLITSKRELE